MYYEFKEFQKISEVSLEFSLFLVTIFFGFRDRVSTFPNNVVLILHLKWCHDLKIDRLSIENGNYLGNTFYQMLNLHYEKLEFKKVHNVT